MALHRKRKEVEKLCSFCKDKMTDKTVHGGYVEGRGRRCCDPCMVELQKEENRLMGLNHNSSPSLGEEQAYKHFGI